LKNKPHTRTQRPQHRKKRANSMTKNETDKLSESLSYQRNHQHNQNPPPKWKASSHVDGAYNKLIRRL
jgi:hypothetical protein